jgi:hypothetical protein
LLSTSTRGVGNGRYVSMPSMIGWLSSMNRLTAAAYNEKRRLKEGRSG